MCRNDVLFGYNIAFAMTFVSCTTAADFPEIMLLTTLAQRLYTYYHYYNYYLCLCPEDQWKANRQHLRENTEWQWTDSFITKQTGFAFVKRAPVIAGVLMEGASIEVVLNTLSKTSVTSSQAGSVAASVTMRWIKATWGSCAHLLVNPD